MENYYITSTAYSIRERETKKGIVYDIIFRVVDKNTLIQKQKKISGFATKTLAKKGFADFVTEYCEIIQNNPLIKKNKTKNGKAQPIFKDLYYQYRGSILNMNKESTVVDKEKFFKLFLLPKFGDMKIEDLTKEVLYVWQDETWNMKNPKTNDFYSYKYLSNIRLHLSAFLSWVEERYNIPNQLKKVKKPKKRVSKTEMKFWTREDFDKFLAVVDNPTFYALFSVLFFTGRRKGEVIALNFDDVKPDKILFNKTYSRRTLDGEYKITTTKNEKKDYTFICEPLKNILANYEPQEPFFFGGSHPIHENTIGHAFERYTKRANLPKIRIHDLRHSFVSMLIHLGASIYVVASLIGDTPTQVLQTYGHLYNEDRLNILAKIK